MFCIHGSSLGQAADRLLAGRASRRAGVVGEQPVGVDQLGGLVVDQGHAADFAGPVGLDDVVIEDRQVDHLAEAVADFVAAVVEAEQADLVGRQFGIADAGERQDRFAELDAKLAGARLDRARPGLPRCGRRSRGAARGARRRGRGTGSPGWLAGVAATVGPSAMRAVRSCASSLTPPTCGQAGRDRTAGSGCRRRPASCRHRGRSPSPPAPPA